MPSGDDRGPGRGTAWGVPTGPGTGDQGSALGAYCDRCSERAYGSRVELERWAARHICFERE